MSWISFLEALHVVHKTSNKVYSLDAGMENNRNKNWDGGVRISYPFMYPWSHEGPRELPANFSVVLTLLCF